MNSLAEMIVMPKADPSAYKVVKATAAGEKYIVSVLVHVTIRQRNLVRIALNRRH